MALRAVKMSPFHSQGLSFNFPPCLLYISKHFSPVNILLSPHQLSPLKCMNTVRENSFTVISGTKMLKARYDPVLLKVRTLKP